MYKKVQLLKMLKRMGVLDLATHLKADKTSSLVIVAYHRVLDVVDNQFPFDEGVISSSKNEFEREMGYIKKHFEVINFEDLTEIMAGRKNLNRCPLVITFDDGYRDNFEIAFPILVKYQLKATIFLPTQFIGANLIPWWDRVNYAIKRAKRDSITLSTCENKTFPLRCPSEKRWAIEEIIRKVKRSKAEESSSVLEELAIETGIKIDHCADEPLFMNWDNVLEMNRAGIEFGSHTVTHAILANIDDERELCWELAESKKVIENHLQREVLAFAFPGGGRDSLGANRLRLVEGAGYRFATCYLRGGNQLRQLDRFKLRRIGKENDDGTQTFFASILLAQLVA